MRLLIIILLLSLCYSDDNLNVINVHQAWEKYPSSSINTGTEDIFLPDMNSLKSNHDAIMAQIREKRLANIKNHVNTILSNKPNHEGHMEAGVYYAINSFLKEAMAEFKISLSMNENEKIYANIANLYYIQGKYAEANENYTQALKLEPNNPFILLNLSFLNYEYGKFDIAKKYYCFAILLDPTLNKEEYTVIAQSGSTAPKASNKGVQRIDAKWLLPNK